ncbi:hypothetical protein RM844_14190 [Streptomyces sp. DSM 44915]|uniref:Uncharacterized protein n=1 Tax=Streptomyces chisholmiae TaxID=3075540 RepID=A0ABU2JR27_9ACTN|nr:hypothetical protein [Streptomyces sp. DSM 44915]MDT0267437.1 hypothetical protein [Streptomyces sp. DSM 44915]
MSQSPETAGEMPSPEEIVAMQDLGDQARAREEIGAATDEAARRRVLRYWWSCGRLSQRPGRAQQYAEAAFGEGPWRRIEGAA